MQGVRGPHKTSTRVLEPPFPISYHLAPERGISPWNGDASRTAVRISNPMIVSVECRTNAGRLRELLDATRLVPWLAVYRIYHGVLSQLREGGNLGLPSTRASLAALVYAGASHGLFSNVSCPFQLVGQTSALHRSNFLAFGEPTYTHDTGLDII